MIIDGPTSGQEVMFSKWLRNGTFAIVACTSVLITTVAEARSAWTGNSGYAAFYTTGDGESDADEATVMEITCDGFNRQGVRYLIKFGVSTSPYFGDVQIGLPITISVDGRRYRRSAVRGTMDREGEVYAIDVYSSDPLWEALQAGSGASIFFGSSKVTDLHLRGSRKALSGISDC